MCLQTVEGCACVWGGAVGLSRMRPAHPLPSLVAEHGGLPAQPASGEATWLGCGAQTLLPIWCDLSLPGRPHLLWFPPPCEEWPTPCPGNCALNSARHMGFCEALGAAGPPSWGMARGPTRTSGAPEEPSGGISVFVPHPIPVGRVLRVPGAASSPQCWPPLLSETHTV